MRQRTVKDLDTKLIEHGTFLVNEPKDNKGKWNEVFQNSNPIILELGSGKGKFITTRAINNPDNNYIAFEGQSTVALRILEKIDEFKLTNLRVVIDFVNDLHDYFDNGEVKGIYLNFSDPWPKARHAKRRLTYRKRLLNYKEIMNNKGFIEFKTDNDSLFDFTLEEIKEAGIKETVYTRDLHKTDFPSKEVTTEYEEKFKSQGKNINFVRIDF